MAYILHWRILLIYFFSLLTSAAFAAETIIYTVDRTAIPSSPHDGVSSLKLGMSPRGIDAKLIELNRQDLVSKLNEYCAQLLADQKDARLDALVEQEFLSPLDKLCMLETYGAVLSAEQIDNILDFIVAGVYNRDIDFLYAYWYFFKHKIFITTTDEHIAAIEKVMQELQLPLYFFYPVCDLPDKELFALIAQAQTHPAKDEYLMRREPNFMYHYGISLLNENVVLGHAYIKKAAIAGHAHADVLSRILEFDAIRLQRNKDGKIDPTIITDMQYFVGKATAIENEYVYRAVLDQARFEKVSQEEIDEARKILCAVSLPGACRVIEDAVKHADNVSDEFLQFMYEKLSQYGKDGLLSLYAPSLSPDQAIKDNTYVLYRLICTKHECLALKNAYQEALCESTLDEIKGLLTTVPSARAYAEQVGLVAVLNDLAAVASEKNQYTIARCFAFLERVEMADSLLIKHKGSKSKYLRAAFMFEKRISAASHKDALFLMQEAAQEGDAEALCFLAINYADIGDYVEKVVPVSCLSAERIARKMSAKIKSTTDSYELSRLKFALGMLIADKNISGGHSSTYSIDQAISLLTDAKEFALKMLGDKAHSEQLAKRIVCSPVAAHSGLGYNKNKAAKTLVKLFLERKQFDEAESQLASLADDEGCGRLHDLIKNQRGINALAVKDQVAFLLADEPYKRSLGLLGSSFRGDEKAQKAAYILMKQAAGMQHPHAILHASLMESCDAFKGTIIPGTGLERIVRIVVGMKKSREMLNKFNQVIDLEYKSLLGYAYNETEKIVAAIQSDEDKARAKSALAKVFTPIE